MNQELQKKYVELQLLNEQIKKIHEQFIFLQQQLNELSNLELTVTDMKEVKKDSEIFSPLGSGIFVNSKLTNTATVLVNIGAGILVEKNLQEAVNLINFQAKNVHESIESIKTELTKAVNYSQNLESEINEMAQKEQ